MIRITEKNDVRTTVKVIADQRIVGKAREDGHEIGFTTFVTLRAEDPDANGVQIILGQTPFHGTLEMEAV